MNKPWDKLRDKSPKPPMHNGSWYTSQNSAKIHLELGDDAYCVLLRITSSDGRGDGTFVKQDLEELIEFLQDLKRQVRGGM